MEIRCGKHKGKQVLELLKEPDGNKAIASYLEFIKKGFDDPKWGAVNKKHYNEVYAEWAAATKSEPVKHEAPSASKPAPSVDAKLDMINIQIKKNFEKLYEYLSKLDNIEGQLLKIDMRLAEKIEIVGELKEVIEKPEDIAWEE